MPTKRSFLWGKELTKKFYSWALQKPTPTKKFGFFVRFFVVGLLRRLTYEKTTFSWVLDVFRGFFAYEKKYVSCSEDQNGKKWTRVLATTTNKLVMGRALCRRSTR